MPGGRRPRPRLHSRAIWKLIIQAVVLCPTSRFMSSYFGVLQYHKSALLRSIGHLYSLGH
jgi:hypothetical protein